MRRHCDAVPSGAAGSASLPGGVSAFAQTMAAWRFYNNPRIEMVELIEPLREYARRQLAATKAGVVMLVHDWCKLSYPGHASKRDQAQLAQANNRGYELTTVLAVNGPAATELKDALVRFSGRQMKRKRPHTAPALLAGLWPVLTVLEYLEDHDLKHLKQLLRDVELPFPILRCG